MGFSKKIRQVAKKSSKQSRIRKLIKKPNIVNILKLTKRRRWR